MKKTLKQSAVALGLLLTGAVGARDFRMPVLTVDLWDPIHYPVLYGHELKKTEKDKDKWCHHWTFDASVQGYYRSASDAFHCRIPSTTTTSTTTSKPKWCCESGSTTHKVPWSTLLFGRPDFTLEQGFVDSSIGTAVANNPWIKVSTLSPRYEYAEAGTIFMGQLATNFTCHDHDYRTGLRVRLPYRDILVFDPCGAGNMVGDTISDVWKVRNETITVNGKTQTNLVFAGRLDFITSLKQVWNSALSSDNMVVYKKGSSPANTTIASNTVDAANLSTTNKPVVALIERSAGTMPMSDRWGDVNSSITGGALPQTGAGTTDDLRYYFSSNTDYTDGSTLIGDVSAAQAKYFVVPTIADTTNSGDTQAAVTAGANQIRGAIETAIRDLQISAADFLAASGYSFCNGHNKGLGDLDLELFIGRNWGCEKQWFTDLCFGVRCPTGKEICNCKQVILMPLGNNKHTEIRLGGAVGRDIRDWVKVMAHGSYSWALSHCEKVAAPFKGATIKNFGPCINADIKWGYFLGDIDVSFFAHECCGLDLGYELYHKRHDDVCLSVKTATDLAGRTNQALDPSVLSRGTEQTAHRATVGLFTTIGDCEISGGWKSTFAGKNMPRETDWYIRMNVAF